MILEKFKLIRIYDLLISIFMLGILSPILLIIFIICFFESGKPLFIQERVGKNKKRFYLIKFRTMNINAPSVASHLVNRKFTTRFGRILRFLKLDELPQFINVIKGEMSLVGPRPHATQHNEFYRKVITGYMQRHSNLPGMTGLAQIEGERGETNTIKKMKRRIQYDMEYNNDWNLLNDFLILIKTILVVLKGDAY